MPALHQREHDFGADVLQRVVRRHGKIAFLVPLLVAEVAAAVSAFVAAGRPLALGGLHVVVARVLVLPEADGIEDEELQLRAEVAGRGQAAVLQVALRLLGDVARVARIRSFLHRVHHVADQGQRGGRAERVDKGGGRVRPHQHVGLVDLLEAADRRSVKADAGLEQLIVDFGQRDREMLPQAGEIREPEVHHLDGALLDQFDHLARIPGRLGAIAARFH